MPFFGIRLIFFSCNSIQTEFLGCIIRRQFINELAMDERERRLITNLISDFLKQRTRHSKLQSLHERPLTRRPIYKWTRGGWKGTSSHNNSDRTLLQTKYITQQFEIMGKETQNADLIGSEGHPMLANLSYKAFFLLKSLLQHSVPQRRSWG